MGAGELMRGELAGTTYGLAPALGGLHPGPRALPDQGSLEFGERAHDVEDEPTPRRGGVDTLGQGLKPSPGFADAVDHDDELPEGAPEAIQFPDRQHIPRPKCSQSGGEARTGGLRPGNPPILKDPFAPGRLKRRALQVRILFVRRDAGIADFHVRHFALPFCRFPALSETMA